MIVDSSFQCVDANRSIAQLLAGLPAKFVMTGSRSFSGAVILPSTDVDLFVCSDELDESKLLEWGFEVITDTSYMNDPTHAIVYRAYCEVENKQYDIQVIGTERYQAKLRAQRILEQFFRSERAYLIDGAVGKSKRQYSDYSKTERYVLWELAIMLVDTGMV